MASSTPVDLYCERVDAGVWSEPVNALTNIAFLVVAALAFRRWRRRGGGDPATLALIVITSAIGLGSFAFHTLATAGSAILDVAPIAAFIYGYFLLALRRFLAVPPRLVVVLLAGFAGISLGVPGLLPPGFLNGSGGYLPALGALIVVGTLAGRPWAADLTAERRQASYALLSAAALFTISLAFRSVDLAVCTAFPLGTHFVWHLLNAAVLHVLLRAAIP
jgi:hypothetical protein